MAQQQVGLRAEPQLIARFDEFAKERFEGKRSVAVRWLAKQMLDQIEGVTASESDIKIQTSSNLAVEIAQLKADVKVLQQQSRQDVHL